MTSSATFSFASRLINYAEPYYIDGVAKTAYYSEVNTNLKKNEKVFILNGFSDSEKYISRGKYVKNADGYRVLAVDRCKIVLDIPWSGVTQSYKEDPYDHFIKVHHVRSKREFDYINKLYVDTYNSGRISMFELGYTNNVIYSDEYYLGVYTGLGYNSGLSSNFGFWQRQGLNWVNVTNSFNYNTFSFSNDYYARGLTNNGRIYVVGEDFTYAGKLFRQRNIYKFNGTLNSWSLDIDYKQPIVTKLSFRRGIFKGTHNDGVFGTYLKGENWLGTQSKWNSGFFINSNWNSGIMRSKSNTDSASYYCSIENGVPVQNTDFSNNKGFGYNYIIDSNILSGQIDNGNFINCNIGSLGSGLTALDAYVLNTNNLFPVKTLGGLYNFCDISDSELGNSTTLDSIVRNSYLSQTKTLNTQLIDTYSSGGEFSDNNGIQILSSDIVSYIPNIGGYNINNIRGVLKLYISDKDFNRLDKFDNFYILKVNKEYVLSSITSDQRILLPIEARYILDSFWDFRTTGPSNNNGDCLASIKTKFDNLSISEVHVSGNPPAAFYSNYISDNPNQYASIDIDFGRYLAFYLDKRNDPHTYVYLNPTFINNENVQNLFSNSYISNADFKNGVAQNILWSSGSNINYPSNVIKNSSGKLKISKSSTYQLDVYLNTYLETIKDGQLNPGSYVWLDSIDNTGNSGTFDISGAYRIVSAVPDSNSNENKLTIEAVSVSLRNTISGILVGSTFSVSDSLPNYVSIHKLMIDSSQITQGLFVRSLLKNTTINNIEFNNLDRDISLDNIQKLRLVNILFKNNNNTVQSGIVHNSHVLGLNSWVSGIVNNSIWNGPTFGGGVFNSSYWEGGIFNGGYFQNSKDITTSSVSYSDLTHYQNWLKGTFNDGVFYNSVWIDGTFNNGRLYKSDWYSGTWNNGILGNRNIPTSNTNMSSQNPLQIGSTQTFWYGGIVENAQVGGLGIIYWYGGKFNDGIFTSYGASSSMQSIWYDGEFNGGSFDGLSRWKNGIFNKGKFRSYYGWTMSSSTQSTDYSWENGIFNNGQFGIESLGTNSTWFNGDFNGGIFQGRVWNNGVLLNGNFLGSSTYSAILNEEEFSYSFTQSYYGLWRNGWVTNIKHRATPGEEIQAINIRNTDLEPFRSVNMSNILWLNGTFDHQFGKIENSIWMVGSFKYGNFNNSVFNPWVKRIWWDSSASTIQQFNTTEDCIWENGVFNGGTFYISKWKSGDFINGTMSGAYWLDGTWHYGNANNIYWENGTWKNGNWDGSPFTDSDLSPLGTDPVSFINYVENYKTQDIILNVANIHRNGKIHLNNVFGGSLVETLADPNIGSSPNYWVGWTFSNTSSQKTDWLFRTSPISFYVPSGYLSNSSVIVNNSKYPSFLRTKIRSDIQIIGQTTANEIFYFSIRFQNNRVGYVSITAGSSDTPTTIAQKLSQQINNGMNLAIVAYTTGNNIIWGTWRTVSQNSNFYLFSTHTSNMCYVSDITASHVYAGSESYVNSSVTNVIVGGYAESEELRILADPLSPTLNVFTNPVNYQVSIYVESINGRTDFQVIVGNDTYNESLTNNSRQYNYSYNSPGTGNLGFSIRRILYTNPNGTADNSTFYVYNASVKTLESYYYDLYNNKLFEFQQFPSPDEFVPFNYGLSASYITLPSGILRSVVSSSGDIVSIKYGNGAFKYGVWENGYWNNGWRASWNDEPEYVIFKDIVSGSVVELSPNLWSIKLEAFTDVETNNSPKLNIGDRISIGNIVCIDVNENRKLITNYFRITKIDLTSTNYLSSITVEVSLNMSVRRIVKDSDSHLIYVSRNVWLSGAFHNGVFKGVWNYGLFKGYPYITVMNDTQWIDGVFDGGRFSSTQSSYISVGQTYIYNTGLIQNFTFRDNNVASAGNFSYNSWIDVNYFTYSMTNIYKDNVSYSLIYDTNISDGNLRGYPTYDVLSSDSIMRNSYDLNSKNYKLGSKYTIYTEFITNPYFNYPFNSGSNPGIDEFTENGWVYSTPTSTTYSSNVAPNDVEVLLLEYSPTASKTTLDNILSRDIEKFRYSMIEFYVEQGPVTTSTTTTTTTSSSGRVYIIRNSLPGSKPYPITQNGYSQIFVKNDTTNIIYLYLAFTSLHNGNPSIAGNYATFDAAGDGTIQTGPIDIYMSGNINRYETKYSTTYYTMDAGLGSIITVDIERDFIGQGTLYVGYSTTPGGPITLLT